MCLIKNNKSMKVGGIILLALGALNFVVALAAMGSEASSDLVGQKLGSAVMLCVIGMFLLYLAKKKVDEKNERDEWNK